MLLVDQGRDDTLTGGVAPEVNGHVTGAGARGDLVGGRLQRGHAPNFVTCSVCLTLLDTDDSGLSPVAPGVAWQRLHGEMQGRHDGVGFGFLVAGEQDQGKEHWDLVSGVRAELAPYSFHRPLSRAASSTMGVK